MHPVVKEAKRRLKKFGCPHLTVKRGRGAANAWLEIFRSGGKIFTSKEQEAVHRAFDEKYQGSQSNFFSIRIVEAEMRLGLRPKQPICSFCGCIWETEEEVRQCELTH
ncbi:MAG: hypothetical protein Q8L57_01430 [bacterium]|nr:hypothetical protein [bacterium]